MKDIYSIYCDESCHLENDENSIMLFGTSWCLETEVPRISSEIRRIKEEHQARGELKWTKVSPSREHFFIEIINYFFSEKALNFRCLVVNEKDKLDHSYYNKGSHESFYYKMYFYLIRNIIVPERKYKVYLDIKDTRSQLKINKLTEVLRSNFHDYEHALIDRIQQIRSSESEILQIADFLMGSIAYHNRGLSGSKTKLSIIKLISELSGRDLISTSPPWDEKFNLFFFSPRSVGE